MICHLSFVPTLIGMAKPGTSACQRYATWPPSWNARSSVGSSVNRRYWSKIGVRFLPVFSLKNATTWSVVMFWYLKRW